MNPAERAEYKDFIFQGIQAGKKETSDLVAEILKKVDNSIDVSVNKYVNGKLDGIKVHLENQDKTQDRILSTIEQVKLEQVKVKENLETTKTDIAVSKAQIWTAIAVFIAVAGVVITLSIMAINSKIKDGINEVLSAYEIVVKP